jgi:hypothetical protein
MTTIGIHQPNYLPWLGYFHKIAKSDVFVFLDDVQFSKNGYCNRVQILHNNKPRWLSIPVTYDFGDPINQIIPAQEDWPHRHIDTFRTTYRKANHFESVWASLKVIFDSILGLSCRFDASSETSTGESTGDDRLVRIVRAIDPGGVYFSGKGGAKYQDEDKFSAAGLSLTYTEFVPPTYGQNSESFVPGLSIVDAAFHLGWEETSRLVTGKI